MKPIIKTTFECTLTPKETALKELQALGYEASLCNNVLICKNIGFKELGGILKNIGYKESYGVVGFSKKKKEWQMGNRKTDTRLQELLNKGIPVYSISRIDSINDCLYSAYRTYVLKDKGHGNVYSSAGGILHDILEDITNGKATEKDLLPGIKEELDNLEAMGIEWPHDRNGEDSIKANWIANMEHFCKTYIAPKNKELKAEEFFLYKSPKGYYFQGYIDLQMINKDGDINIYDYKSSTLYKGEELKSHARQLILYALGKEQEGFKVKSANWIFLKYCTVKFMGCKTKKSKEKTEIVKHIERRKLATELEGYLYNDLIEAGYDEFDAEMVLDKYKNTNIMRGSVPDKIAEKYIIRPCVISVDLTQENKDECIQYIENTVVKWETLDTSNEHNFSPKTMMKVQKNGKKVKDTWFCHQLCNHGYICRFLKDFEEQWVDDDFADNDLF